MNIAFICGLFPQEEKIKIIANSKGVIQYAADALQWSFVDGLKNIFTNRLTVINLPYIGGYPCLYKKFRIEKSIFGKSDEIDGVSPSFCNLMLYKNFSRYLQLKKELIKWVKKNEHNRIILIYAVHVPFLKAVDDVKKKYSNLKIIVIVPDVPEFMSENKSIIYKLLKKANEIQLNALYNSVDGYVLLTKYMVERIPVGDRPFVVVEGIFNPKDDVSFEMDTKSSDVKTIFYSGTLAKRYGVMVLVRAFSKLINEAYRLVICGNGDSVDEIIELSKSDKRIIYKGQLPRSEILELQKKATLLVNPRSNEGEFTKFSFPSKTMEYLASGVPTLLCKLPGIPEEYYKYCFSLNTINEDCLKNKINDILLMDEKQLLSIGNAARNFILQNKNPSTQCAKVIDLIHIINN